MLDLVIQSGKRQGCRLTLPKEKAIIVGRDPDCHLTLSSTLVSRRHCELKQIEAGISVVDLNSQNGTYVNEVAVTAPMIISPGDVLRIGACVFEVQAGKVVTPPVELPTSPRPSPSDSSIHRPRTSQVTLRKSRSPVADISDDDVSEWLTDSDTVTDFTPPPAEDTTIIRGRDNLPHESNTAPPAFVAAPQSSDSPRERSRSFQTVKEEAAEIIRRHREAKARGD